MPALISAMCPPIRSLIVLPVGPMYWMPLFFAVDQINCAFRFAVKASIDKESFFCVMTGEFCSCLHEFTYDTWAIAGPGASWDSFWVYVCLYQIK